VIPRYRLLQSRILAELEELDRTETAVRRHWKSGLSAAQDQDAYINSVALNLHSFYSGLERIFELIAVEIDGGKLSGGDWHVELLRQMTLNLPGVRPAVLRKPSAEQLDELRRFRHRVRNIYAANLQPQRMGAVVETLPDLWGDVRRQLEVFAAYLDELSRADESDQ
jgi:hypothetical protein